MYTRGGEMATAASTIIGKMELKWIIKNLPFGELA